MVTTAGISVLLLLHGVVVVVVLVVVAALVVRVVVLVELVLVVIVVVSLCFLPCILISTNLFCQQMHFLLKHKMLQFVFKIYLYMAPKCLGPFGPSSGSV